jgi:hypothetical protein
MTNAMSEKELQSGYPIPGVLIIDGISYASKLCTATAPNIQ